MPAVALRRRGCAVALEPVRAYPKGMALVDGETVYADLVAVAALLDGLFYPIMAPLAQRLQLIIGAPKQIEIAVMWCLVIDNGGSWVRPAGGEAAAATRHLARKAVT